MTDPHPSPEENLLKLIRQKKAPALSGPTAAKASGSPGTVAAKDTGDKTASKSWFKFADALLVLVIVSLGAVVMVELRMENRRLDRSVKVERPLINGTITPEAVLPEPKPFNFYSQEIAKRDIFQSIIQKIQEENEKVNPSVADMNMAPLPPQEDFKNFKLVGIVLDAEPEAIVEDSISRQTYFLHIGDLLKEATVEDIQESKVILKYKNGTIELKP